METSAVGQVVRPIGQKGRMVVAFVAGDGSALDRTYGKVSRTGDVGCEWFDRDDHLRIELVGRSYLLLIAPREPERFARPIRIGAAVRLRSGGPVMTVGYVSGDGSVLDRSSRAECDPGDVGCQWHDSSGAVQARCFKPAMLELCRVAETCGLYLETA